MMSRIIATLMFCSAALRTLTRYLPTPMHAPLNCFSTSFPTIVQSRRRRISHRRALALHQGRGSAGQPAQPVIRAELGEKFRVLQAAFGKSARNPRQCAYISESVARRFSVERMADEYIALYQHILATNDRSALSDGNICQRHASLI